MNKKKFGEFEVELLKPEGGKPYLLIKTKTHKIQIRNSPSFRFGGEGTAIGVYSLTSRNHSFSTFRDR